MPNQVTAGVRVASPAGCAAHSGGGVSAGAVGTGGSAALLSHFASNGVLALYRGEAIGVQTFLADVHALAAQLPQRGYVLNACGDRYLFTVAWAAALLCRQVTLLPANHADGTLRALSDSYPGVYALSDRGDLSMPTVAVAQVPAQAASRHLFEMPQIDQDQIAIVIFTSGSTGQPVPTCKSWGSLVYSAQSEALALGIAPGSGMSILGTVPAQHSYGLESTVMLAMHNGLTMHSGHPFFPADVVAALQSMPRPRMLVTTPVHLRALCATDEPVPQIDLVLSATAALPMELATQAQEGFCAPVMEIYGCSEAGQLATRTTLEGPTWRLMRGVRLRQDANGTWASGGHVPSEVLLADVIEVVDEEEFVLHGRTADLVNIAGKRTSLSFLNHQLNAIDGVIDGTFFLPDEADVKPAVDSQGEGMRISSSGVVSRLMAFVVAPGLDAQDVLAALRKRIDAAHLPRPLYMLDALPRNTTGKLPRAELEALAQRLRQSQGRT